MSFLCIVYWQLPAALGSTQDIVATRGNDPLCGFVSENQSIDFFAYLSTQGESFGFNWESGCPDCIGLVAGTCQRWHPGRVRPQGIYYICLSHGSVSTAAGGVLGQVAPNVRLEWSTQLRASHNPGLVF